jgi:adenine phosphoribosyltransferase
MSVLCEGMKMKTEWPEVWKVRLGPELEISLPLTNLGGGFYIYSFDMTGEAEWNRVAAKSLTQKLAKYDFYSFVTVQTKSSGLTQAISGSVRSYLKELWIGREKYEEFVGKKLCFIDDVVSTGGTVDSVLAMAKEIGFEVSVIACVLTEGEKRTEYRGIPLVSLDHIPLPGVIGCD